MCKIGNKQTIGTLSILIMIMITAPLYAETGNDMYRNYGEHMMNLWDMGWMMLLLWSLLLMGFILVIRWLLLLSSREKRYIPDKSSLEILKERLASGEIEINEFEERKKIITE